MKFPIKKVLIGCVLLSVSMLSSQANELTDDYFDIAQNYYIKGNTTKAIEYIDQILKIEKDNVQALGLKIKLMPPKTSKKLPDINKALIFDAPYISCGHPISDSYYVKGLNCYKSRDYSGAEENLKNAIRLKADNYRAYNTLGLVFWAQKRYDEAKMAFTKSNTINKQYTLPLDNLAQIYKQLYDYDRWNNTLQISKSINSNDFCVYLLLGDYYRDTDNYENALANYREVIKINPDYNLAYLKIAKIKTDNLDFKSSNETLNYYLNKNPKDDYAYYMMSKNYVYMNDYNKAKGAIYKAILLNNCKEYREELGKLNYKSDDIQDALDAFNSTVGKETSAEIYNYIGMCYYNLHDFNKAILNVNKAISMPDTRVIYYYNLAQIYKTLKDEMSYKRYMNLVKDFQPLKWQDYIDLSEILYQTESKNSAILTINQGIEKYPKIKELYIKKLKIYEQTHDIQGMGQTKLEMENAFKQ